MITKGSLCSGYGGLDSALPGTLAYVSEVDPAASWVLKRQHPDVPNLGDFTPPGFTAPHVDLFTAGFPCQPVSAAGRQKAHDDHRWLWPYVLRVIRQSMPGTVFLENVQNIVSIQKGEILAAILSELRESGYAARWTVLGACAVGAPHHRHRWFLRAERVSTPALAMRILTPCGAPRSGGRHLLPIPVVRDSDGRGKGDREYWQRRADAGRANGMPLGAAVQLLPTPTTADASGGPGTAGRDGGLNLRSAVQLLPSPRASDGKNGGPNQGIASGDIALSSACQPERWGRYAQAIETWEQIIGRAAPAPTEPAPRGGRRLNAALSEWMMGLPSGLVTEGMTREEALRLAGNGVVPMQARAAWDLLTPTS